MSASPKIRVLVVDDSVETRAMIQRMLQFDADIDVVGQARSGSEGLALATKVTPDVVVMDISMPDMDGISATEAIRQRLPFTQVIILTIQNDTQAMRRAMLAGARDFIAKPPSIEELANAVHRAATVAFEERAKHAAAVPAEGGPTTGPAPASSQGAILTVYGPKGGVGCTSLAVNLAVALSQKGPRVALVDADLLFGSVPILLNLQVRTSVLDLTEHIEELDPDLVREVMLPYAPSGLSVLAAPPRPEDAARVAPESFSTLLHALRALYDLVIVDTAHDLNPVTEAALTQADLILLLSSHEIPALRNAGLFLGLAQGAGVDPEHVLFVVNGFDRRSAIPPARIAEILKKPVGFTIPLDEKGALRTAINLGVPVVTSDKGHPFAKAAVQLGELVQERLGLVAEAPVKK
jgi:pilus assembly protein CpaE